jgi:DNA-binding transcriptional ArsR family regulator
VTNLSLETGWGEPVSREERCEVKIIDEDRVREAATHLVNGLTATRLAETFKALSDPTRVRIISALSHTELCVCDLAATLGMSQSATSHQLRTLRQLRLVKNRKEGRQVYYSLDDEHIYSLFEQGLDHALHS